MGGLLLGVGALSPGMACHVRRHACVLVGPSGLRCHGPGIPCSVHTMGPNSLIPQGLAQGHLARLRQCLLPFWLLLDGLCRCLQAESSPGPGGPGLLR